MRMLRFLDLIRARAALVTAVFISALISGAAVVLLTPEVYEVSTLLEVKSSMIGPYSVSVASTIRQAIESGVLNAKIADKSGLKGQASLPKMRAKVLFQTQLIKVYVFAPSRDIEKTKKALNAMPEVLNEEFPAEDASYSRKVSLAVERAQRLEKAKIDIDLRLRNAALSPEMKSVSGDLTAWVGDLSDTLREYASVITDGQTQYAFRIRMVAAPAVSDLPEGPSPAQAMMAFSLLGLFAGFSAVLWRDERKSEAEKRQ